MTVNKEKCEGCIHFRLPNCVNAKRWCMYDDGSDTSCKSKEEK